MTFNIYVPSYRRSGTTTTKNFLEYCTYVVRESEKNLYESIGVKTLAVDDGEIGSIAAVSNWIIDNAPEDVVCIADDDITGFVYRLDSVEKIGDPETITAEIERLAQVLCDLRLGYLATPQDANPKFYDRPYRMTGITGQIKIFNRKAVKSRMNDIEYFSDLDFQLHELVLNRAVLIPAYFIANALMDTNKGGSNDQKTKKGLALAEMQMQNKWGLHFRCNPKTGIHGPNVKR